MANTKAAASRRASKTVKSKTDEVRPGRPIIRMPWERHRQSISIDPETGLTHQSFKDECDINNIIDLHTRTGMVTHLNPGKPQYGVMPDSTLFDAACAQAEIRSALEEGWEPPAYDSPPEGDSEAETENVAQKASEAVPEEKDGDRGGD